MAEHRLSDALVANLAVWASDAKPTTLEVEALACEVQESRAEIERLRAAGDALAEYLMMSWRSDAASDLVAVWKEARRG